MKIFSKLRKRVHLLFKKIKCPSKRVGGEGPSKFRFTPAPVQPGGASRIHSPSNAPWQPHYWGRGPCRTHTDPPHGKSTSSLRAGPPQSPGASLPPPRTAALWCDALSLSDTHQGGEPGSWLLWLRGADAPSGPAALHGSWGKPSGDAPPQTRGWLLPTSPAPALIERTPSILGLTLCPFHRAAHTWIETLGRHKPPQRFMLLSRVPSVPLSFRFCLPLNVNAYRWVAFYHFFGIRTD